MKMPFRTIWLLIFLASVSACSPTLTPTKEIPTTQPQPTSTAPYHPLSTRTGITAIDQVLNAVESGDPQKILDSINFTTTGCKTVNALGGPPPCNDGEAEGTVVEVLPILGAEGGHLRKKDLTDGPYMDVTGIYAIYHVSENVFSDEYYPKGEYAVILVGEESREDVVLQIKDGGIVRIDYIFDDSPNALSAVLERSAAELILAPIE